MKKTMNIDFNKNVKITGLISAAILIFGLLFSVIFPVELDLEFKGGTEMVFSYVGDLDKAGLQDLVEEKIGHKVDAKDATTFDGEKELNTVTYYLTEHLDNEVTEAAEKAAVEKYKDFELTSVQSRSLSASMGSLFLLKCLVALGVAALLLLVYVAIRFRKIGGWSAGMFGILALVHDMLIAYLAFVVFRIPLNGNFVAVMLSVLGYSLNDTIVVFDRVRENRRLSDAKTPISTIVNQSVNQCFVRTLNTSITTLLAIGTVTVLALVFGMDAITSFALPMTIGVIAGFYSSTFLCVPLWGKWVERKQAKK